MVMSNIEKSVSKVLEMVYSGNITAQKGTEIISKIKKQDRFYYSLKWTKDKTNINHNVSKNEETVLILGKEDDFYHELRNAFGLKSTILISPETSFHKKTDNIYNVNIFDKGQFRRVIKKISSTHDFPNKIICTLAFSDNVTEVENVSTALNERIYPLFYFTQALIEEKIKSEIQLIFVYCANEIQPQYAALSGFMRTVRLENPKLRYKLVKFSNIESNDYKQKAEILKRELCYDYQQHVDVLYKDNHRYIKDYEQVSPVHNPVIKHEDVILITGGAGKLGMIFAKYLIENYNAKIIVTGRSPINDNIRNKIDKISKTQNRITYIEADISNKDMTLNLVNKIINDFGKLDGVIHCAGVINDSFILKKKQEEIQACLAPKVYGTVNLYNSIKDIGTNYLILCSSISAVFGNVGQMDYSFANSFMDYFALKVSEDDKLHTISINWPLWEDGGIDIDKEKQLMLEKKLGITPISEKNALDAFEVAVNCDMPQIMVLSGDEQKIDNSLENIFDPSNNENELIVDKGTNLETRLNKDEKEELFNAIENYLKQLLSDITKFPINKIDSKESFETIGLDSIIIMNINERLEEDFGEISKTIFYEYQNLNELTSYFLNHHREKAIDKFNIKNQTLHYKKDKQEKVINKSAYKEKLTNRSKIRSYIYTSSKGRKKYNINNNTDIAIIGVNGRYPMANNIEELWENLKSEKDCITEIPKERWDWRDYYNPEPEQSKNGKTYSKWGGFLEDFDKFDPLFFNISPMEAEIMDPQERLFLETAWATLEDGGYTPEQLQTLINKEKKTSVGVFVGVTTNTYDLWGVEEWTKGNMVTPNALPWSIANRVSYIFNFQGPSVSFDTACSSSLVAIHSACESLKKGECSVALAGGVNLYLHPYKYVSMCKMRMLSPTGKCSSFGEDANGFVPGEGVGAILLKPLEQAIEDNDYIYAVIKGTAVNHGGKTNGFTVPNPNAQADLILSALEDANINARHISYVEAHGTGTVLGDPIEITGLTKAFKKHTEDNQYCSIGSIKANIGHLEAAAGIASVTKILLQMKYKKLVPSINSNKLNSNINFAKTPFYVQHELQDWKRQINKSDIGDEYEIPKIASVSSFGAGGTNAHIILEEHINNINEKCEEVEPHIITLSAQNKERLKEYAYNLLKYLDTNIEEQIAGNLYTIKNIASTLNLGRKPMNNRLAIVVTNKEELREKLNCFYNGHDNIEGLHIGNIKDTNGKIKSLLTGEAGKAYFETIISERNFERIAQLWVLGIEIDWHLLYTGEQPKKIPLVTYPFAKERYWFESKKEESNFGTISNNTKRIHSVIDSNISTLEQQCFLKVFSIDDEFIKHHVIQGKMLVPGVVYLEMAWVSGNFSSKYNKVSELKDIVWVRPLEILDHPKEAEVVLNVEEDNISFEIISYINDIKEVYCEGKIVYCEEDDIDMYGNNEIIDIEAIIKSCSTQRNKVECYDGFKAAGFNYGPYFNTISNIFIDENFAIAQLEIDENNVLDEYTMHPGLMDGALQTAGVLLASRSDAIKNNGYLPFMIEQVQIFDKITGSCYVYVELQEDSLLINSDVAKFNIWFTDNNGVVKARINNYSARAIKNFGENHEGVESTLKLLKKLADGQVNTEEVIEILGGI